MAAASEDHDLGQELRESMDNVPRPAAPPPLPPKRSGTAQPTKVAPPLPAAAAQAPAPSRPAAGGDPFGEPPEPRPPRGGLPEEKLEYFRLLVKQKDETLARGRTLYAQLLADVEKFQALSQQLRTQVDALSPDAQRGKELPSKLAQAEALFAKEQAKLKKAEERIAELLSEAEGHEADRRDLSRALAETEAQVPALQAELEKQRRERSELAEEMVAAKESLAELQERVADLTAQKSEVEGNLEAVQEQYQNATLELDRAQTDLVAVAEERDAARSELADLSQVKEALKGLEQEKEKLEVALAEASAQLAAETAQLRAESAAQLQQETERAESLERELLELRERVLEQSGNLEAEAQARSALEEEVNRLQSELDEAQNARADAQAAASEAKRTAGAVESKHATSETQVQQLRRSLQESESDGEGLRVELRRLQEELAAERNKKAAASSEGAPSAEVEKLRQDVAALKKKLVHAEGAMEAAAGLKAKVAKLEAQLKASKR